MNKNRFIAAFCIFLIIMLPVCMADEFEQEGETLIIEAKQYEPAVLRSDYMEQLNIPVRVVLGAIRGEPISVPEINSVSVKLIKKQEAQKKNASVQGTPDQTIKDYVQGTPKFYKAPYPTLDNLGYVQITLKKIPKETEVPKQIDLDFEATINYEAEIAGFTIGGENQKELKIATVGTIKENPEEYKILGGRYYLRVVDITSGGASAEVLDQEFNRVTSTTLKLGEASRSISLTKDELEPNSIRLKLEEVRGVGTIKLELQQGTGKTEEKTFEKNKEIERGWKVSNYYIGEKEIAGDEYIILENKEFKTKVILSTEGSFNKIEQLENLIDNCEKSECKIYALSNIKNIKDYPVKKDLFKEALNSLKGIGIIILVSVAPKQTGRLAKVEMGGLDYYFSENEKIGSPECKCKVYSITRDEARVGGVKNCDKDARDIEILKTGETYNICGTVLTLKEITTDEKAVITVLPGTGKGKTTTYFSVHIPVEKRAIQYTPEELQEKINKTEALIKKLDSTISQLQKLVDGWTKICLATMAVFTVMAFFQGVSGTPSKTGAGAQTGESTKPEEAKKIPLPEGVAKFSELKYGHDNKVATGNMLALNDETYYFIRGAMYDSKNEYIVYQGAKFKHEKSKSWYVLTSEGVLKKTEGTYGDWGLGSYSGKYEVRFSQGEDIAVGLQSCSQIPHGTGNYANQCDNAKATYGSALVLIYYKKVDSLEVWSAGGDGKLQSFGDGKEPDDKKVFDILPQYSEFKDLKRRLLELQEANKRGEKTYNWGDYKYDMGRPFKSGSTPGDVDCRMVMDESRCKILFNACDPVMCPPSRCNFGGRYKIDNVIQSGLLGSLLLCLPNIKDGVIMPICLSGVLASLKNIRSILQGYVDCLKTALNDQKSVGICDRIRSIFMCEILWREAMTMLGLARGNLFDAAVGSGGGEYLTGLKGGVDNAKKTVDYFTNSYASSVFASYKGKSTKEIGSVICEKAIYGKGPLLGDIVEDVTKAQNPTQFMAYIEEEPLYQVTEQKSAYKLYYHIYAGSQQTDYKVYVKKGTKTFVCPECSGTINAEGYVDKSTLFTLEPGYNTICVKIGNKEECNLGKVVSTSFGVNKAYDYVLQHELSKQIETEEECRADMRGILPNAQVEKVCSIMNPVTGKGKGETDLWKKVGTCGKNKEGAFLGNCWMKLGELEKYNPEAYREVVQGLCKDDQAKVCEQYQSCTGRQEITTVIGYKTVVCCYGECKENEKYTTIVQALEKESFLKEMAYKEMYDYGKGYCESTEYSNNNPFSTSSSIPTSWIEKQKEIEQIGRVSQEEKNKYYYFKGAMYLVCGNCAEAPKEFNKISDRTSPYFTKACGTNELPNGGIMFDRCKETCSGVTEKPSTATPTTEKPAETKVLKLVKVTFTNPSNKETEPISITDDTKEIELKTTGTYNLENLEFNKPVKECSFYFGTGELKTVSSGTTICRFTTPDNGFTTTGVTPDKLSIYFLGEGKTIEGAEGEVYAKIFNIKISETAVKLGKTLLCKTAEENYFCIGTVDERCSNYHSKSDINKKAIFVKEVDKSLEGCKLEFCTNYPDSCVPSYHSYEK